jgi:hypothetical protein
MNSLPTSGDVLYHVMILTGTAVVNALRAINSFEPL